MGDSGLFWLFLSYGYVLYYASNLISEGSDLLMLIPSLAGLVGSVVLPLLGAVPDGAIMLFSGLGDIETAQETLSVGVGALAGSTIMLLTIPWGLSIYGGRVDLDADGVPDYRARPKLTPKRTFKDELEKTGVSITEPVSQGAIIMIFTTIPYFLIQVPAFFIHGPSEEVAKGEKHWALAGLIICLLGFASYLGMQFRISQQGEDKGKRVAVVKKLLKEGKVSLKGALAEFVQATGGGAPSGGAAYGAVENGKNNNYPDQATAGMMRDIFREAFRSYDDNNNGNLDKNEVRTFLRDFNEDIEDAEMDALFERFDEDGNGVVSFDEFIGACYLFLKGDMGGSGGGEKKDTPAKAGKPELQKSESSIEAATQEISERMLEEDEEEMEEIPEDITDLSPAEQQKVIKKRAFTMLAIGTVLVVMFSDPMVDVMQEIANRMGMSPFYVSFVLAPLASNASEVIASLYYASKKTRKTITVSLTALEGAASMNNTFCLSIFMGLIYFRGLAWQYTAETISIVAVQVIIGFMVQQKVMTMEDGFMILLIFPASIIFVAILEALGLD